MPEVRPVPQLDDIRSKDSSNTFNRATDSLEAIRDYLVAALGTGVSGLYFSGTVDSIPGANQFTITSLAGLGASKFLGANPYYAFILRDAGGAAAAPQSELQAITAYDTALGTFTTAAFTAAVDVSDEVLVIHPSLAYVDLATDIATVIASLATNLAAMAVPAADAAANAYARDVIGNKADTALYAATATDSLMRYIKALLGTKVIATGTLTTDSTTVPADNTRTEDSEHFKGCTFMALTGAAALQPRPIRQFTLGTGIFTLDEALTSPPGLVTYVILASDYPIQRLLDIFTETNAILELNETGGTLTATGAEDTLYLNNAPAGEYEPKALLLDLDLMQAGDTILVRVYYRIKSGGGLQLYDYQTYTGADGSLSDGRKLISVDLLPNRYGVQVTLEQTAGVNRDYDWAVHMAS